MRFLSDSEHPRVAVIGFGYVGSCIAATLAEQGCEVVGVDTDRVLVEELARGHCRFREHGLAEMVTRELASGRLHVTTDVSEVRTCDVVLITVGTPIRDDGTLADEQLRAACLELGRHLRENHLVVLKSTVPPGTTRETVLPLLESSGLTGGVDFGLAFTPERLSEGTALRELRTFPIVAGGLDADSTNAAATFWHHALGVEVTSLESPESAEIVKLATNWWIDTNISVANELAKYCALHDVDVLDVVDAANTIPKGNGKVNLLLPSIGVGGSCLTKDPWMVWRSAAAQGLDILTAPAGRAVNAGMPEYAAKLVTDELLRQGKEPATARIAVLGLAFKNNTGDLRATPVQCFVEVLSKSGAEVRLYDPLVDVGLAEDVFGTRPATDLWEAVRDADCIAVLALHREFEDIDFAELPVGESCLLVDGRAYYDKQKIAALRRAGYTYRGIGR